MAFERFDIIRVINLASRADRRAEVAAELAKIGLATDGRVAFHEACAPDEPGGFPSKGARGCFLSHLAILQEAEAIDASVLILEDDADFVSGVPEPDLSAFDVFYGGYLARSGRQISGTHCVGFSAGAAKLASGYLRQMLERPPGSPEGGPMHVDGAYSWFLKAHPELRLVVAEPPLAVQRPSRTDIHDPRFFDRLPVLRNAAGAARRLRRRLGRTV